MSDSLYLCLDQGGRSSRAIIVDQCGRIISQAQQQVAEFRVGNKVELSPDELVSSLRNCAQQAVEQLSATQRQCLAACGLITQRSSLVAYNQISGEALSQVISWQDTRAADLIPQDEHWLSAIYQSTGLRANAHFGASKMRWLLEHHAPVKQAFEKKQLVLSPLAGYLVNRLLDNHPVVVDRVNASRTLLMNVDSGDWDETMLHYFAIPYTCMPKLVSNDECLGNLVVAGENLPLTLLTGDQNAAAFNAGWFDEEHLVVNIGTGAFALSPTPKADCRNGLLNSVLHWREYYPPQYSVEGTVNGAASAVHEVANSLGQGIDFDALETCLTVAEDLPLFINTVSGLGSPDWRSDIAAEFINDNNCDDLHKLAAVIESIVFLLQRNIEMIKVQNKQLQLINISGGLSQSNQLCQRLSDLSGLTVQRFDSTEASAIGAAYLMAGKPQGWCVDVVDRFKPQTNAALQQRYQQWGRCLNDRLNA